MTSMEFQTDSSATMAQNEDLTQILPIQQKRTIALVNSFIMQTVSFFNNFAQSCESQFMKLDYRMKKIEASLLILESQLSSIEGLKDAVQESATKTDDNIAVNKVEDAAPQPESAVEENDESKVPENEKPLETKVKIDVVYQKFFKMVQVGVPLQAVKLKMQVEGLDPNVLDMTDVEFAAT